MRTILTPLFGLALLGASGDSDTRDAIPAPVPEAPTPVEANPDSLSESCRDRISQAREASGQPPLLRREPASPENPLAIYAVDRTQDGCSVVVMMGEPEDIRPVPEVEQRPVFREVPENPER
ncbi:MAG: hypothetical protein WA985_05305 [Erythrobacter sp.]